MVYLASVLIFRVSSLWPSVLSTCSLFSSSWCFIFSRYRLVSISLVSFAFAVLVSLSPVVILSLPCIRLLSVFLSTSSCASFHLFHLLHIGSSRSLEKLFVCLWGNFKTRKGCDYIESNKQKKNSELLQNPCEELLVKNKHSVLIFVKRVPAKTLFITVLNEWWLCW